VVEPPGAFAERFMDETEIAVLEVAKAPMEELGGGSAGGGHEGVALVKIYLRSSDKEGPGSHETINTTANDCDVGNVLSGMHEGDGWEEKTTA
jgi:hypothetical protein